LQQTIFIKGPLTMSDEINIPEIMTRVAVDSNRIARSIADKDNAIEGLLQQIRALKEEIAKLKVTDE
jgi:hypothetical protein